MFYSRLVSFAAALVAFSLASGLVIRQDSSSEGQPISVGLAANRSAPAASVFGTTTNSPNFLTLPTTLCIPPMYADEAGIGHNHILLTVQFALELCPRAQTIVVSDT